MEGEVRNHRVYRKRTKRWDAVPLKEKKGYIYVTEIQKKNEYALTCQTLGCLGVGLMQGIKFNMYLMQGIKFNMYLMQGIKFNMYTHW